MSLFYENERAGQVRPSKLFKAIFFLFLSLLAVITAIRYAMSQEFKLPEQGAIKSGQIAFGDGHGNLRWVDPPGKEQARLVIKSCPIATTKEVGDGRWWDTGISVVNVSPRGTDIVVNRLEFFDARGENFNVGFGFNQIIKPNQRWSRMLSEIIGRGRDGILQVHVLTPEDGKWYLYEAVFVDPVAFIIIEAKDVTSRSLQP